MKANSVLPMLLALAACGAEATPSNAVAGNGKTENGSPAAASVAAVVAAQPEDWAGEYEGQGGGGNSVIIRSTGNNRYSVWMDTFNRNGCGGEVEGGAVVSKDQLVMTAPITDGSGRVCRMFFTRTEETLRAEEESDCSYFHGMSCEFRGSFTRKAGTAKPVPSNPGAVAVNKSWLVGIWIHKGGYCASGDPLVFELGGGHWNAGGDFDGSWSLSANKLTLAAQATDNITGEAVGPKKRATYAIEAIGKDEMVLDGDAYRRCPTGDGFEPWHPKTPFDTE